jgi:hypothetical protein
LKLTEVLGSREDYLIFKYRKIWNVKIAILGIEITNNYIEGKKLKTEGNKCDKQINKIAYQEKTSKKFKNCRVEQCHYGSRKIKCNLN